MLRRRIIAAAVVLALVAAGLIVHALPHTTVADVAGDALYALAIFAGLVVIAPRAPTVAIAAIALAWCFGVEFLQLTPVPTLLSESWAPWRLVFGSGFDGRDLVVYAGAVVVAGVADGLVRGRRRGADSRVVEGRR